MKMSSSSSWLTATLFLVTSAVALAFEAQASGVSMPARAVGKANQSILDAVTAPVEHDFQEAKSFIRLSSSLFDAYISRESGLLSGLVSKKPTPVPVIPLNGRGLAVYFDNLTDDSYFLLDRAKKVDLVQLTNGSRGVRAVFDREEPLKFQATIEYVLLDDIFRIRLDIRVREAHRDPWRVGFTQNLDTEAWPEILTPMNFPDWWPGKPGNSMDFRSSKEPWVVQVSYGSDWLDHPDWRLLPIPLDALRRDDRILVFGEANLATSLVMAPNLYTDSSPSFFVQLKELSQGRKQRFDLIMTTLSRPENEFAELIRWYYTHTYFKDKAGTMDLNLIHWRPRPVPPGMFVGYDLWMKDKKKLERFENALVSLGMTNIWGVQDYDHFGYRTTSGEWGSYHGEWVNAGFVRQRYRRLREKGFHVWFYEHPFVWLPDEEQVDPRERSFPPHKSWLYGSILSTTWFEVPTGPDHSEKVKVHLRMIDFTNPDARAWYLDRLKATIREFDPDGMGFDYGWVGFRGAPKGAIPQGVYDRDSDNWKGFTYVQYEFARWLRENYPDKRIIQNSCYGGPGSLLADATILELGVGPQHPWNEVRGVLALGLSTSNFLDVGYVPGLKIESADSYLGYLGLFGLSWGTPLGGNMPFHVDLSRLDDEPVPMATRLMPIYRFSALAQGTPVVWETRAIRARRGIFASAWASPQRLMIACMNPGDYGRALMQAASAEELGFKRTGNGKMVEVEVDRHILEAYGCPDYEGREDFEILQIGWDLVARSASGAELEFSHDKIRLRAVLAPGEALLIYPKGILGL